MPCMRKGDEMSKDDNTTVMGCVGAILSIPLSIVLKGWVMTILWGWFVVPLFHAPSLRIPYALGLSSVIAIFGPTPTAPANSKDSSWAVLMTGILMAPLWSLAWGWLIHLWL